MIKAVEAGLVLNSKQSRSQLSVLLVLAEKHFSDVHGLSSGITHFFMLCTLCFLQMYCLIGNARNKANCIMGSLKIKSCHVYSNTSLLFNKITWRPFHTKAKSMIRWSDHTENEWVERNTNVTRAGKMSRNEQIFKNNFDSFSHSPLKHLQWCMTCWNRMKNGEGVGRIDFENNQVCIVFWS